MRNEEYCVGVCWGVSLLIEESTAALLNWIRKPWCLGGKNNSFIGGKEYCMTKTRQTRDNCDSKELMQPFLLDAYAFLLLFWIQNFKESFVSHWQMCLPPLLVWKEPAFINSLIYLFTQSQILNAFIESKPKKHVLPWRDRLVVLNVGTSYRQEGFVFSHFFFSVWLMRCFGDDGQRQEFLNPTVLPGVIFLLTSWVKSAVFSNRSRLFSLQTQLTLGSLPAGTTNLYQ